MANCTSCGADAGFMKTICQKCINAQEVKRDQIASSMGRIENEPKRVISTAQPSNPQSHPSRITESREVSSLMTRYKDGYLVARVTAGLGSLIKGIGIAAAALLLLIGLALIGNARLGDAVFAMGIVVIGFAIFVGIQFYLLGILVSAQGQILKASLDSAINGSPFLTNAQRAKIMSL